MCRTRIGSSSLLPEHSLRQRPCACPEVQHIERRGRYRHAAVRAGSIIAHVHPRILTRRLVQLKLPLAVLAATLTRILACIAYCPGPAPDPGLGLLALSCECGRGSVVTGDIVAIMWRTECAIGLRRRAHRAVLQSTRLL